VTQFRTEINHRIATTQESLRRATAAGDHYLADVHLGELESLARLAASHGVHVAGVDEALAAHGGATPAAGIGDVVDLTQAQPVALPEH
jgi:hypothetical protein